MFEPQSTPAVRPASQLLPSIADVTNGEFVAAVFRTLPEGAEPVLCSFPGDPQQPGRAWTAQPVGRVSDANNNFICAGSFYRKDGTLRATADQAAAAHFILLDDLGGKVPLERLNGFKLSWIIETSPGNFQGGIIFNKHINKREADELVRAIIDAGLSDPSATGSCTRWARLPNGVNGKLKHLDADGEPFQCRLKEWRPDARYTPQQIIDGLDLSLVQKPLSERAKATAPSIIADDRKASFGLTALQEEANAVSATLEGSRNARLFEAGVKCASLVAGGCLDARQAQDTLIGAAQSAGLTKGEAVATLKSAWKVGAQTPRVPKDRPMTKIQMSNHQPSSLSEAKQEMPWPELRPLKTELPPVDLLDPNTMLPDDWRDYLIDRADATQANIDHLAVLAFGAYGATLGKNIRIHPRRNDSEYVVVPNPWVLGVALPSLGKTPLFNVATAPLRQIEREAIEEHAAYVEDKKRIDGPVWMQIKGADKLAQKKFNQGKTDEANEALSKKPPDPSPMPPTPSFLVDTTTVQALALTLRDNPAGVALFQDEVSGWFAAVSGQERAQDRAFFLAAYNGTSSYKYDTISRGKLYLPEVCMSIGGFIQPSKLTPFVDDAVTERLNDGLLQRFQLMVMPDPITEWRCVDRPVNARARDAYFKSFRKAFALRKSAENGKLFWKFDTKAQRLFSEWLEDVNTRARSNVVPGAFDSHCIKLEKTVASIALMLEIANGGLDDPLENSCAEIGLKSLQGALVWAKYLESHARRIYGATPLVGITKAAATIVERRAQLPKIFGARDIYNFEWSLLKNARETNDALDLLLADGFIRSIKQNSYDTKGRSLQRYIWHPDIDAFTQSNLVQAPVGYEQQKPRPDGKVRLVL